MRLFLCKKKTPKKVSYLYVKIATTPPHVQVEPTPRHRLHQQGRLQIHHGYPLLLYITQKIASSSDFVSCLFSPSSSSSSMRVFIKSLKIDGQMILLPFLPFLFCKNPLGGFSGTPPDLPHNGQQDLGWNQSRLKINSLQS
jgi:hypothetical protein